MYRLSAGMISIISPLNVVAIVLSASFASYIIFKQYEPRRHGQLIILLAVVPMLLAALVSVFCSTLTATFSAFVSYYFLLLFYTVAYRLSPLHPLALYPGPVYARVSKWWSSYICADGKQHIYYKTLHDRFGDVVRVGPNELSIRDASAIPSVLGVSGLPKGPFWDHRTSPPPLIGIRDPHAHAERRQNWNRGFTSGAIKQYELILANRCRQLVECFDDRIRAAGEVATATVDAGAWMSHFTTDFLGDMAFGEGFDMMADGGDPRGIWSIFESGMKAQAIFGHTSWSLPLLSYLPGHGRRIRRMRQFGEDKLTRRMRMGPMRKDLFYHLNDEEGFNTVRPTHATLASDTILSIVAGSDTTATVLTALIWYLLKHPETYTRLQEEVDGAFPPGDEPIDATKLANMPYLNACINETMRLQPPVPSGSQRSVLRGTGPKVLGSHIIPEGTQIFIHTYSVHHDPRNFSPAPDSFVPERWLASTDLQDPASKLGDPSAGRLDVTPIWKGTHNSAAFMPFSYGPTACVGKNLALLEMRMVACWLLSRFTMRPAKGTELQDFEESIEDYFVVKKGPLWVEIQART